MRPTIYEAAGGREAIVRLAQAWHARCLADEVVSHAFSHGYHPQHSERLAAYWAEALGGPAEYSEAFGNQSGVVRIHSGNGQHREMDERAEACFALAIEDAGLPEDLVLRQALRSYFHWGIEAMNAYPRSAQEVPAGMRMGRWSWEGPVK